MSQFPILRLALAAAWVSGMALPLQAQPATVALAPRPTLAVKPRVPPPPAPALPTLSSVYPGLRNQIALALGIEVSKVPLVPVIATGLTKVGNVVTIHPLGPNQAGFGFRAKHVNIERYLSDKKEILLADSSSTSNEKVELSFDCDEPPVGSYLFFVNFGNSEWSYAVSDYANCTPLLTLPGNRMVAFEKTAAGWLGIGLFIPLKRGWPNAIGTVDVMRVK